MPAFFDISIIAKIIFFSNDVNVPKTLVINDPIQCFLLTCLSYTYTLAQTPQSDLIAYLREGSRSPIKSVNDVFVIYKYTIDICIYITHVIQYTIIIAAFEVNTMMYIYLSEKKTISTEAKAR